MGSPRYRCLYKKTKGSAGAWLGKGHQQDGNIMLGFVVCHPLRGPHVMTNLFASFQFAALPLFEASGRPDALWRRGWTTLHTKAAFKFYGIDDEGLAEAFSGGRLSHQGRQAWGRGRVASLG